MEKDGENRNKTERLDNLIKEIDDLKQGRIKVVEDTVDDVKK